jgi:hypothetical protein
MKGEEWRVEGGGWREQRTEKRDKRKGVFV